MNMQNKSFTLFGLSKQKKIIEKIITDLNEFKDYVDCFDIRLMLTEGLTNAFYHGNDSDKNKPIYLRYIYNDSKVIFEIEDSGAGFLNTTILEQVSDEKLLSESGRGLFLIKCIADDVELVNNKLIMKKNLNQLLKA